MSFLAANWNDFNTIRWGKPIFQERKLSTAILESVSEDVENVVVIHGLGSDTQMVSRKQVPSNNVHTYPEMI
jgi:hypothetical protein